MELRSLEQYIVLGFFNSDAMYCQHERKEKNIVYFLACRKITKVLKLIFLTREKERKARIEEITSKNKC